MSEIQTSTAKHEHEPGPGRNRLLGCASQIYVISLPERRDRHEQMERLRTSLDLSWTIVDAMPFANPLIHRLLDWVGHQREQSPPRGENPITGIEAGDADSTFRWPCDINAFSVLASEPLLPSGSDLWTTQPPPLTVSTKPSSPSSPPSIFSLVDDLSFPTGILREVEWMKLTPARVACWYSHVSAIRRFVDKDGIHPEDVAVFLEDDIDMERNVAERLAGLWKVLPGGWDIVLLGHAWSNESSYPPLPTPTPDLGSRLHPSHSPKCTHAYALSLSGARRLLQHLRYPLFAYSRALDHAFAWLIESGRLRAYSVVPSVVVQRKDTPSDILPGLGSKRTQWLVDGVLGS